jgi:hypothetical protein
MRQNRTVWDNWGQIRTRWDGTVWDSRGEIGTIRDIRTFSKEWGHFVVRCCANFVNLGLFGERLFQMTVGATSVPPRKGYFSWLKQ